MEPMVAQVAVALDMQAAAAVVAAVEVKVVQAAAIVAVLLQQVAEVEQVPLDNLLLDQVTLA
jgi:hypothetical protein